MNFKNSKMFLKKFIRKIIKYILREYLKFDIIMILILVNILVLMFEQIYSLQKYFFSIENLDLFGTLISFFRHSNYLHLMGNILTFWSTSRDVYDSSNTKKSFLKSWKMFLSIYIFSGIIGSIVEISIFEKLSAEWQQEIKSVEDKFDCNFFLCKYLKKGVGYAYSWRNYEKVTALNSIKQIKIIGAESCIYGIIGAELIKKIISKENFMKYTRDTVRGTLKDIKNRNFIRMIINIAFYLNELFGFVTLIFDICSKFIDVPWNINFLLNKLVSTEISHNSHLGGALAGITLALIYYTFESIKI
jgi:membrane associated rhomboid family serine protease